MLGRMDKQVLVTRDPRPIARGRGRIIGDREAISKELYRIYYEVSHCPSCMEPEPEAAYTDDFVVGGPAGATQLSVEQRLQAV